MLEPIPFLGWFNWFEEQAPMNASQIMTLHKGWSDLIGAGEFALIVKEIEEHHGIK